MSKINPVSYLILFLILLFATTNLNATDEQRILMLASPCAGCHGPDGISPGSIPSLSGKDPKYISMLMKAFKNDSQKASVMNRIAKGYTDEEIELIAQAFKK